MIPCKEIIDSYYCQLNKCKSIKNPKVLIANRNNHFTSKNK